MSKRAGALSAGLTIMALAGAAMVTLGTSPAQAVVYCKTVGVPKGCVVRPTAAVVVAPGAPVARAECEGGETGHDPRGRSRGEIAAGGGGVAGVARQ